MFGPAQMTALAFGLAGAFASAGPLEVRADGPGGADYCRSSIFRDDSGPLVASNDVLGLFNDQLRTKKNYLLKPQNNFQVLLVHGTAKFQVWSTSSADVLVGGQDVADVVHDSYYYHGGKTQPYHGTIGEMPCLGADNVVWQITKS